MQNSIQPGDGLVIDENGLIDFKGSELNVEIKQIDTSAFTDVPNVFIKKSNTVIDHNSHKDYENICAKLTIDCMDNTYSDVNHTQTIPDNTVLQKYNGQILWDYISNVQIEDLEYFKIISSSAISGFVYFNNATNASILQYVTNSQIQDNTLSLAKLTSQNATSTVKIVQNTNDTYSLLQPTLNLLSSSSLLQDLSNSSQSQIYNSQIQSLDFTKLTNSTTNANYIMTTTNSNSFQIVQKISPVNSINWHSSVINLIDLDGYVPISSIQVSSPGVYFLKSDGTNNSYVQISFSDIQNTIANGQYTSFIQTLDSLGFGTNNGYVLSTNGSNSLSWIPVSSVSLNALLTSLNTQSSIYLSQIQTNSVNAAQFLFSQNNSTLAYRYVYFGDLQGQIQFSQFPVNSSVTIKKYIGSINNGTPNYYQIDYSEIQSIPSVLTTLGTLGFGTNANYVLSSNGSNSLSWVVQNTGTTIPAGTSSFVVRDSSGAVAVTQNINAYIQSNNIALSKITKTNGTSGYYCAWMVNSANAATWQQQGNDQGPRDSVVYQQYNSTFSWCQFASIVGQNQLLYFNNAKALAVYQPTIGTYGNLVTFDSSGQLNNAPISGTFLNYYAGNATWQSIAQQSVYNTLGNTNLQYGNFAGSSVRRYLCMNYDQTNPTPCLSVNTTGSSGIYGEMSIVNNNQATSTYCLAAYNVNLANPISTSGGTFTYVFSISRTTGNYTAYSDKRMKKHIKKIQNKDIVDMKIIEDSISLEVNRFSPLIDDNQIVEGYYAQEMQENESFGLCISKCQSENDQDTLVLDQSQLLYKTLQLSCEQSKKILEQEQRIQNLEQKIQLLMSLIK